MTGLTNSTDFPTTAVSQAYGGGNNDGFLSVIDPEAGAFVYSRYVGGNGSDGFRDIVVDSAGNAHLAGGSGSTDMVLVNALDDTNGGGELSKVSYLGEGDALVASFDSTGAMIFGTFLGGSGGDLATGLALDSSGLLLVAGGTESTDMPTVNAYQSTNAGGADSFAAHIGDVAAPSVFLQYVPIVRMQ